MIKKHMAKQKEVFFCKECGYESPKWLGQCPFCKSWNSFTEEKISLNTKSINNTKNIKPVSILEITYSNEERIKTNLGEFDLVLGGGIVRGSLVLVGGDPGIGKSTLLLQVCKNITEKNIKVLYISGEESLQQIKIRAERIGNFNQNLLLLCEINMENILIAIENTKPEVVIIDSIQTMYTDDATSTAGSVSQVREVTNKLMQMAKTQNIATFIVGHVTKEGVVAGPRTLEHMVDTVLYFEGERSSSYRIIRGVKNRFGSTNEIGVFEMQQNGLNEVKNPSKVMLNGRPIDESGSVVVCSIEGTRPILIEIQALVSHTNFNIPRRTSMGIDFNRVNILMAVLEKKLGLQLGGCDAYINLAGGMKLNEPAIDLGILFALVSSYKNRVVDANTIIFGEVGLTGEVRAVSNAEQRILEAEKLGFLRCILPMSNLQNITQKFKIKLIGVSNIRDALNIL